MPSLINQDLFIKTPRLNIRSVWNVNAHVVQLIKNSQIKNGNGAADVREGKDVSHKKALDRGGSNKDGYFVQDDKKEPII